MPAVLGRHRMVPPYGTTPFTESQGNDQYVTCLFIWGYGPIQISEVKIGDSLLSQDGQTIAPGCPFSGVQMETRFGFPGDAPLTLINASIHEEQLSVLLTYGGPQSRTSQISVSDLGVDVTCPNGLTAMLPDGSLSPISCGVGVSYRPAGSQDPAPWVSAGSIVLQAATRSAVRGGLRWTPRGEDDWPPDWPLEGGQPHWPGGQARQYDVRLQRWSADDDSSKVSVSYWTALRSFHPGTPVQFPQPLAMTALRIKASNQLNGVVDQLNGLVQTALADSQVLNEIEVSDEHHALPPLNSYSTVSGAPTFTHDLVDAFTGVGPRTVPYASLYYSTLAVTLDSVPMTPAADPEDIQPGEYAVVAGVYFFNDSDTGLKEIFYRIGYWVADSGDLLVFSCNQAPFWYQDNGLELSGGRVLSATTNPNPGPGGYCVSAGHYTVCLADVLEGQDFLVSYVYRIYDSTPTQNPADLFRLVLQGPANARPLADSRLDLTKLAYWQDYCDTQGFTYNKIIDYNANVWDVLQEIAAAGRAAPAQPDGKWGVIIDEPQTIPAQHLSPRNSFQFEGQKIFTELPHGFRVKFFNEQQQYQQDERIVLDDGCQINGLDAFGVSHPEYPAATRFETLELPGITHPDLIFKQARYHIAVARLRPETYSLSCDLEHLAAVRGDLVRAAHDVPFWGLGLGRIKERQFDGGGNLTHLILDEQLTMEAGKSYNLRCRLSSGFSLLLAQVTAVGTSRTVELAAPIAPGQTMPQAGDLALFGETGLETALLLLKGLQYGPDLSAKLTLVDYNPAIYAADQGAIPPFQSQISLPPAWAPPRITGCRSGFTAALPLANGFLWRILAEIYRDPDFFREMVWIEAEFWRAADDPRVRMPLISTEAGEIALYPVQVGATYNIRLRLVRQSGGLTLWSQTYQHTVVGPADLPAVGHLTSYFLDSRAQLQWQPPELAALYLVPLQYEVRRGDAWESAMLLGRTWMTEFATQGDGLYWVAPRFDGFYGPAAGLEILNSVLPGNILVTRDEAALGWPGLSGLALVLDDSHYATAADHADLNVGTGDFTPIIAFQRGALSAAIEHLLSKWDWGTPWLGYDLGFDDQDRLFLLLADSSGYDLLYPTPALTISDLDWHVLGASVDRDGNIIFCLDGNLGTVVATRPGSLDNLSDLFIGCSSAPLYYFNGQIDLVRLHKRALSAAELQAECAYLLAGQPPELLDAVFMARFEDSLEDDGPGAHTLTWQGGGSAAYAAGIPPAIILSGSDLILAEGVLAGYYLPPAPAILHLGSPQLCQLNAALIASLGPGDFDSLAGNPDFDSLAGQPGFDDLVGPRPAAKIQIALSQDGLTWGAYQDFLAKSYFFQDLKWRLDLMRAAAWQALTVSGFSTTTDLPDRELRGVEVTCPDTGLTVNFTPAFQTTPLVAVTILDVQAGDLITFPVAFTNTGGAILITNGGNGVQRAINWFARGY